MKTIIYTFLFLQSLFASAQTDSTKKLTFTGFGDIYYSYDFSNPQNHLKPDFIYNHKRHNEINANLLMGKVNYTDKTMRANLGLMAGNYPQFNLAAEPDWAKFIYEANIGVKLSNKHNLWLDAGIMPSHIGFESAISADCWTLTRSIVAENSPYYETGLKLSFINKPEKLQLAFFVLNGWQRIKKPDFIQKPSIGFQANYTPQRNLTINYSNFIGTDKADSLNALRTYHNFYMVREFKNKVGLTLGFDIGTDKYNAKDYGIWYSPVMIVRYSLSQKTKIALRGEYYFDKNQIIIATNSSNGFRVAGLSSNFDYAINKLLTWRIEGKIYKSKDQIFEKKSNNNFSLSTNLSVRF